MYRIATLPANENSFFADIEIEKRTKKAAIKEYLEQIKEAFDGETVICYNNSMMKNYEDLMPQVKVRKKTEWRYGSEVYSQPEIGSNDWKRCKKYEYLGKVNY